MQKTFENYISSNVEIHTDRIIPVAAMRFGYLFPLGRKKMTVEINALGPHKNRLSTTSYTTKEVEILTQLSLGIRVIF